jgi:hypothetical protein
MALEARSVTLSYPRKRYFPDAVSVADAAGERNYRHPATALASA